MLDMERRFLESHRDELLKQYGWKFLVIKGEEVTGAYETMSEALQGTALKNGLANVLICQPAEADVQVSVPALALGIIRADPSHAVCGTGERLRR